MTILDHMFLDEELVATGLVPDHMFLDEELVATGLVPNFAFLGSWLCLACSHSLEQHGK